MSITQLQQQIESRNEQVAELERRKGSALIDIEGLEIERKKLIVPARAGNNKAAQERIDLLDKEISRIRRGMEDDNSAIAALNQEIEALSGQVQAAQKESRRKELRTLASETLKRAEANSKLVTQLIDGLKQSADDMSRLQTYAADGFGLPHVNGPSLHEIIVGLEGSYAENRLISPAATLGRFVSALSSFAERL